MGSMIGIACQHEFRAHWLDSTGLHRFIRFKGLEDDPFNLVIINISSLAKSILLLPRKDPGSQHSYISYFSYKFYRNRIELL